MSLKLDSYYQMLRLGASVMVVLMPAIVSASTEHLPLFFEIIVPSFPFLLIVLASTPPDRLGKDGLYKKAGALLFSGIGAIVVIVTYAVFYSMRTEAYAGGGADIGMGLVMLSMPVVILVVMAVCWVVGEIVGAYIGRKL